MRRKRIRLSTAIPTLATDGVFAALATYNVPWHESVSAGVLDLMYSGHSGEKLISPAVRHGLDDDGELPDTALDELAEGMAAIFDIEWQKLWDTMALEYSPIENYNMTESESIDRDETRQGTDTGTLTTVTDEDTTDTGTDATNGTTTRSDTGTVTTGVVTTDTGTDNRAKSETEEHDIYGFNSVQASDADTTTRTGSDNETRNLRGTSDTTETRNLSESETRGDTETRNLRGTRDTTETETRNLANSETAGTEEERTLTRRGNIGVTTTQQMITQEREVWQWLYFEHVFKDVDKIMCLTIY